MASMTITESFDRLRREHEEEIVYRRSKVMTNPTSKRVLKING